MSDAAARLSIAYPLHSECENGVVTLRGFVDNRVDQPVALAANGHPIAVANDSSFAATVPASPKDIIIDATLASGKRLSRRLHVDRCFDRTQAAVGTVEDDGAPFAAVVRSGEAATLHFAGATLEIPKGAVDSDTRITIRPLVPAQLASMTDGIENVSPEGYGFRFGPHGMKFKKPVKVTLPYDRRTMVPGAEERNIFGFFYDEPQHKWVRIGRFGVAENGALASLTEHFTDFVNATIAMPIRRARSRSRRRR